ncbi:MAG: FHA domain-containing protein [Calothrix sp. MO_167.B12]|nr:FHA domain-containing protein [Calothrix sp. MO_167.B12]
MNALTLQWHDAGQEKTQQISDCQASKNPGTFRIGRDPLQCDLVLSDGTVSRLHIEIFFHQQQQNFHVRNLKPGNPPLVDGRQLFHGEMPLRGGSTIRLGQQTEIKVVGVANNAIATTIITPPTPPVRPQSVPQAHHHQHFVPTSPTEPEQQGDYGLECPKCHKVSSPEHLQVGCPWCGTSLAAAVSVLVAPER